MTLVYGLKSLNRQPEEIWNKRKEEFWKKHKIGYRNVILRTQLQILPNNRTNKRIFIEEYMWLIYPDSEKGKGEDIDIKPSRCRPNARHSRKRSYLVELRERLKKDGFVKVKLANIGVVA